MEIEHLRINHQENAFVDHAPEVSWWLSSPIANTVQTSYRILASKGTKVVYDSGKVCSRQTSFLPLPFELESKTHYGVKVQVETNHGDSVAAIASFDTGYIHSPFPDSQWIASPYPRNEAKLFVYGIENRPVWFKRKICLDEEVKEAHLYATSYGCYLPYWNGRRIARGDFFPDFTPYNKILNYQHFNLSDKFIKGENELSFLVGDGWFFCPQTEVKCDEPVDNYAVIYELDIVLKSGKKIRVVSNGSEDAEPSNIVFSDIFQGEKWDQTCPPLLSKKPIVKNYSKTKLRCQPMPPVCEEEYLAPVDVYQSKKGELIVDFGQVITGKIAVDLHPKKGQEISFAHAEVTDKDGCFFRAFSAAQKDTLISDGSPCRFSPLFTYHGFRYVMIEGLKDINPDDIVAIQQTTLKENRSSFECDDERFNRLYRNIRYSQRNNMLSIPTDCPTREKAGWTGDVLVYVRAAIENEEMTPFLTSWLDAVAADQLDSGVVPLVVPYTKLYDMVSRKTFSNFVMEKANAGYKDILPQEGENPLYPALGIAGWSDAIVKVPYELYRLTGNQDMLRRYYMAMKRWCDYIQTEARLRRGSSLPPELDQYLWNTGFHFGEWLVPGDPEGGFDHCAETAFYVAPFYGYYSNHLFGEIASILGEEEDAKLYENWAKKSKEAIQKGLMEKGKLDLGRQGPYVLAFAFDLVPDSLKKSYADHFLDLVSTSKHLGTGFLATPYLLDVLVELGRKDLAKEILFQDTKPSWLYEVKSGATSIWESWEAMDENHHPNPVSFDHYAFGIVDDWMLRHIAGIDIDYSREDAIRICPDTSYGFHAVKRTVVTESGPVRVECNDKTLFVTLPANAKAVVTWKGKTYRLNSGTHVLGH